MVWCVVFDVKIFIHCGTFCTVKTIYWKVNLYFVSLCLDSLVVTSYLFSPSLDSIVRLAIYVDDLLLLLLANMFLTSISKMYDTMSLPLLSGSSNCSNNNSNVTKTSCIPLIGLGGPGGDLTFVWLL